MKSENGMMGRKKIAFGRSPLRCQWPCVSCHELRIACVNKPAKALFSLGVVSMHVRCTDEFCAKLLPFCTAADIISYSFS